MLTGNERSPGSPWYLKYVALPMIFAFGIATILATNGNGPVTYMAWQSVSAPGDFPPANGQRWTDVWGADADDLWVVGPRDQMIHWDGSTWSTVDVTTNALNRILTIWGSAPDDIWAGGDIVGAVLHWDGSSWASVNTPSLYSSYPQFVVLSIWGFSANDVWAVGEFGKVMHWDGVAWTAHDLRALVSANASFFGVWGAAPNDVWAVGTDGLIIRWTGSSWSVVRPGTGPEDHLHAISGTSPQDIWAVGDSGFILHWDGSSWSEVTSGTSAYFESVWAVSPSEAWAGGRSGSTEIFQWDGSSWTSVSNPLRRIQGIWGFGSDDAWAVGSGLARYVRVNMGNP
jgi:hypothetical protein